MSNNFTTGNTLAHENILKEEQNIGIFFAAFAIQFYFSKEMLSSKLFKPNYLKLFSDIDLFASQRVFIMNIIKNKKYYKINQMMEGLFLEYHGDDKKMPYINLLNRMNKGFLIRQIFGQTDQILSKYLFISNFLDRDITQIDFDSLYDAMESLPTEQQILVLSRIFILMSDSFEQKKKTIYVSFLENTLRVKTDYESKGKTNSIEYSNLILYQKLVSG